MKAMMAGDQTIGNLPPKTSFSQAILKPTNTRIVPNAYFSSRIFTPLRKQEVEGAHSQNREDVRSEHDEWLAGDSKDRRHKVDGEYYVGNFDEYEGHQQLRRMQPSGNTGKTLGPRIGVTGETFRSSRITKFASGTRRKNHGRGHDFQCCSSAVSWPLAESSHECAL